MGDTVLPVVRSLSESSTQTFQHENKEQESQFPDVCDAQIQVSNSEGSTEKEATYDMARLNSFLLRVFPDVLRQLEANQRSKAFKHYIPSGQTSGEVSQKLYGLQNPEQMHSSVVAWNCTGSILAVGREATKVVCVFVLITCNYGQGKHEKWCSHSSSVRLWNLARSQVDSDKPHRLVETDGCVTALAFHPRHPSVLAFAKVDGEVLVVDCMAEDSSRSSTISCTTAHQESVTGLHWASCSSPQMFQLISCCLDGKILVWDWTDSHQLEAVEGYHFLAEELPRNLAIKSHRPGSCVGVTCFSFNTEDKSLFVVGTEGGNLFQCSRQARSLSSGLDLKSPLGMAFERHSGYVRGIQFCPEARNIFASVASDGELHLYSLLQARPVFSVHVDHELSCVGWHPSRSGVLAVGGVNGHTSLYDMRRGCSPVELLSMDTPILDLQFGTSSPHLLASGGFSEAQVWSLPPDLDDLTAGESDWLLRMSADRE